jgi:hypothetical protein
VTRPRRLHAFALLAITTTLSSLLLGAPALADTAPVAAGSTPAPPATVSADALPTVQVDGVVWTQIIVGHTVYVGGDFANAYPAGAKAGTNLTRRADMLAYDLTTGDLKTGFAPVFNAQVRALVASADGRTIYAGGYFTTVSGRAESRIVALDAATGAVRTGFTAKASSYVMALARSGSTIYAGGAFTSVNGAARARVAAVDGTTGAVRSWNATVSDQAVRALAVSPDGKKLALGGSFSKVDGTTQRGLAMVDTTTGRTALQFAANTTVHDYGSDSSILSLWSDGTSLYGSGYVYGSLGNFEGTFRVTWSSGSISWLEDCHGDTYSVAVLDSAVYTASHAHYCGDVPGGFPQTRSTATPSIHQHALAFSTATTGKLTTNPFSSYAQFAGQPAPSLLAWYPDFSIGSVTGQYQAAWSVTTGNGYVLYGGEFPKVDGVRQAGLVRFATRSLSPNAEGPRISGSSWTPTAVSTTNGGVRVGWATNWDRDNENLTYKVFRSGDSTPVFTTTAASDGWWKRPHLSFVDSGLTPGSSVSYQVTATDPLGNTVTSATVTATVGSTDPSAYAQAVLASGAVHYWRLDEAPGGTTGYDWAGGTPLILGSGVTTGTAGALAGDPDHAGTFTGDGTGEAAMDQIGMGANTFSVEAWFKTATKEGGTIVGFGNLLTGDSEWYDRAVVMDTTGRVHFDVGTGTPHTVGNTKAYNDGAWHHAVAVLGAGGERLYIDGALVGSNTAVTSGGKYGGYWHIGGDPAHNGTRYFAGAIDDVALYPSAVSSSTVAAHYELGHSGAGAATTK